MKKAGWAFGILAAVLLAFLLGFALGRNEREGSVSIYYGASAPSASKAPPGIARQRPRDRRLRLPPTEKMLLPMEANRPRRPRRPPRKLVP